MTGRHATGPMPSPPVTEHIARIPLWLDVSAVAFGAMQGGSFGAQYRHESNFDHPLRLRC
ncbi:MAG TPA: hypothetical protein VIK04_07250 [Solirubrobacteraceae bacterium]